LAAIRLRVFGRAMRLRTRGPPDAMFEITSPPRPSEKASGAKRHLPTFGTTGSHLGQHDLGVEKPGSGP